MYKSSGVELEWNCLYLVGGLFLFMLLIYFNPFIHDGWVDPKCHKSQAPHIDVGNTWLRVYCTITRVWTSVGMLYNWVYGVNNLHRCRYHNLLMGIKIIILVKWESSIDIWWVCQDEIIFVYLKLFFGSIAFWTMILVLERSTKYVGSCIVYKHKWYWKQNYRLLPMPCWYQKV